MASHASQARALSFDTIATQYAAIRPGYPPALFDAIEELTGRPLVGADVLDCGAGTGIATRLLRRRGAREAQGESGEDQCRQDPSQLHVFHVLSSCVGISSCHMTPVDCEGLFENVVW